MSEVEGNDNRDVRKMGEMRLLQSKNEKSAKTAAAEEHTGLDKPPLFVQQLLVCHLIFSAILQQQDAPDSSPALECLCSACATSTAQEAGESPAC